MDFHLLADFLKSFKQFIKINFINQVYDYGSY
jgi:hypothetical protein